MEKRQVKFFWVPLTGTEAFSITESILKDNPLMRMVCLPPDKELFSKMMQLMQGGLCRLPILHLPGLGEWPSHERDIMAPFEAYNQFVTVRRQIYSIVCVNHHRVETLPVLVLSDSTIAQAAHYVALNGFRIPNDEVFPNNTSDYPYRVYRDTSEEFTYWEVQDCNPVIQ